MNNNDRHGTGHLSINILNMKRRSTKDASITAIEFMTYHHEVLSAFCKYTVELNINTLIISPSTGIKKAIQRFAAGSFKKLKDFAELNEINFSILISDSPKEIASHIASAKALFIGTIPPASVGAKVSPTNSRPSRYEEMLLIIKEALKRGQLIYIVIHKPQEDAARLITSLEPSECAKISAIYLSTETAELSRRTFPNKFRSELIMPVIGLYTSCSNNLGSTTDCAFNMIVAGEISSSRRNYANLAGLCKHRNWLQSQKVIIQIIGRIKLESWQEKLLRLCALPASWLFILKYPSLMPLWRNGCLDLSMARYSKISDQILAESIINSTCLLDLKRQHYTAYGQTTGAIGLAMTHEKPLVTLETVVAMISSGEQTSTHHSLQLFIQKETETLIAEKERLVATFRRQLKNEIMAAVSTQD